MSRIKGKDIKRKKMWKKPEITYLDVKRTNGGFNSTIVENSTTASSGLS